MKHLLIPGLLLACGALWTVEPAQESIATKVDAKAAFAHLKGLAGEWQANSSMGKSLVSYELVGDGNVVLERETMEHMPPMITMYHLDGDRLILTHYCMAGNQPRMLARRFDAKTGELRFEFLDATNLKTPNDGHMRNVSMHFGGGQAFSADWEFFVNGKRSNTESFQYTRIR